jgi:hypothetical protein
MYVKNYEKVGKPDFLASDKFVAFTYQASATDTRVAEDAYGRKILPMGSIYPANDATAIGITFHDCDLTEGDQPVSVMVEGWVLEARLPVAPSTEAKTAMSQIGFKTMV